MAFDKNNESLRNPEFRKIEFRDLSKEILYKDRDYRKNGWSVDTGGAIARAIENAYKLGFHHASNPPDESKANDHSSHPAPDIWKSIPSRARSAFESIMGCDWIVVLGHSPNFISENLVWNCYWKKGHDDVEYYCQYAISTLKPLINLELMAIHTVEGDKLLHYTAKGVEVWNQAVANGNTSFTRTY